jgi:hypothetical protein
MATAVSSVLQVAEILTVPPELIQRLVEVAASVVAGSRIGKARELVISKRLRWCVFMLFSPFLSL